MPARYLELNYCCLAADRNAVTSAAATFRGRAYMAWAGACAFAEMIA